MKTYLLILWCAFSLLVMAASTANGGSVSGTVTDDAGTPVADLPVSDGITVVTTDQQGHYELELKDGQPFVFVHLPDGMNGSPWFVRKPTAGNVYDFHLRRVAKPTPRSFIQITDTETPNMDWAPSILNGYSPDFLFHTGDLCRSDGIPAHAAALNEEKLGWPVFFCVGNHDIVAPWGPDGKTYADYMPPYWYSFDWGNYLVIVGPELQGDVAPPFRQTDFGDWMIQLLAVLPKEKPVIFIAHWHWWNNPDWHEWPGNDGRTIDLSGRLAAYVLGHYHHNVVSHRLDGAIGYCTSVAQRGGIPHSPATTREFWQDENGTLHSRLHWNANQDKLFLTTPGDLGLVTKDGCALLSATAWYRGNPVEKLAVVVGAREIPLERTGTGNVWSAQLPLAIFDNGDTTEMTIIATRRNGETLSEKFTIQRHPQSALRIKWMAQMETEALHAAPIVADGRVFTASADDHEGTRAAVYAWNAEDGSLIWKHLMPNTVPNTMAYSDGCLFAQSIDGNVTALDAATGNVLWQTSHHCLWPASSNGICLHNGILYAGYRTLLSAYNAATGKTVWSARDKAWLSDGWRMVETTTATFLPDTNGNLFIGANWDGLYCLDATNGEKKWKHSENWMTHQSATPLLYNGRIYAKGERVVEISDSETGEIILNKEVGGSLQTIASPVMADGTLVVCGVNAIFGLDPETLDVKWKTQVGIALVDTAPYASNCATVECTPCLWNDLLWFGANDGMFYAIQPSTGQIVERHTIGAPVLAPVTLHDNHLYLVDFCGRVFCLEK